MSRSGVSDWVVQRVTAIVLAAYTLCILGFIVMHPGLTYAEWSAFFNHTGMRIFTMLALFSTCAHAWVGMWTVGSDYLREHMLGGKAASLRIVYQIACILTILAYLIWGINILWGSQV